MLTKKNLILIKTIKSSYFGLQKDQFWAERAYCEMSWKFCFKTTHNKQWIDSSAQLHFYQKCVAFEIRNWLEKWHFTVFSSKTRKLLPYFSYCLL